MSLLAWYKLDGDATDSSGNGKDGVVEGSVTYTSGIKNQAAVTDTNQIIHCNISASFPTQGTISIWAYDTWLSVYNTTCFSTDDENSYDAILIERNSSGYQLKAGNAGSTTTHQIFQIPNREFFRWFHFTITWDTSANTLIIYLNGRQVLSASNTTWPTGDLSDFVIGRGYSNAGTRAWHGRIDDVRVYDSILTPNEIQEIYLYLLTIPTVKGATYINHNQSLILDDFMNNNLLGLFNYTDGNKLVRNYIIYEGATSRAGYIEVSWPGSRTISLYILGTSYDISGTMRDSFDAIKANLTLRNNGIDAFITGDTNHLQIISTGNIPFRNITIVPDNSLTVHTGAKAFMFRYVLVNYRDNQIFVKTDSASILEHGKLIYSLPNSLLLTDPIEIQEALTNKLAELKDPKARCFVDIPFDYNQPKELDTVEVRLSYQNQGQFRSFKEGGHFKAWSDSGTYRFKQFYIIGISHGKDGKSTRLRLIEKLS